MRISALLSLACAMPLAVASLSAAEPIPNVGPTGKITKVHGDFKFTEGPTWGPGNVLYFTDIPANRIYRTDGNKLDVFVEPSGHCNGLMYAGDTLYACSMDGQLLTIDENGKSKTIAATYKGKRFNAPNDLVVDQSGGVYFTDPRYSAPKPWPQGIEAVYYRAADGTVSRIISDLNEKAPNGVILSPDEKTLYVVCSMQAEVMQYAVVSPGKIGPGAILAVLEQPQGQADTGGDGVAMDTKGNLYVATRIGIQVLAPDGQLLGAIAFPEQPSNVAFGGPDLKTLYVTARTGLYAAPMEAKGHQFPGAGALDED